MKLVCYGCGVEDALQASGWFVARLLFGGSMEPQA